MTKQQTLGKAIQRAMDNGWQHSGTVNYITPIGSVEWLYDDSNDVISEPYQEIIFNHDFAKALWGEEEIERHPLAEMGDYSVSTITPAWMLHLKQMVVAEDPIKYLGQHLEETPMT